MGLAAIIGGTGYSHPPDGFASVVEQVHTEFGEVALTRLTSADTEFVFLPRHGAEHHMAPHAINFRANIAALATIGAANVIATNAVGSLRKSLPPGTLIVLNDFIDFARSRPQTMFAADSVPRHVSFADPYCPRLRRALISSAKQSGIALHQSGTYLCVDGPRFETPAEVRLFAQWGADVVGMTGLPEAVLAREVGLCYASIAIVTNMAEGLGVGISHEANLEMVRSKAAQVSQLVLSALTLIPSGGCDCAG